MWIDCTDRIDDEPITLSVERLDEPARERTAAAIAWIAAEELGDDRASVPATRDEFIEHVLRDHIAFSVSAERASDLDPRWWHEAIRRALTQFVRQNGLTLNIARHMRTMRLAGRAGLLDS